MKNFYFFLVALACFSCKINGNREAFTYSRNDFQAILFSIHELEGRFVYSEFRADSLAGKYSRLYDSIFLSHETSRQQFFEEYDRYLRYKAQDLDSMYDDMLEEGLKIKDSLKKVERHASRIKTAKPTAGKKEFNKLKTKELTKEKPVKQ